jgi:hypothetical protein
MLRLFCDSALWTLPFGVTKDWLPPLPLHARTPFFGLITHEAAAFCTGIIFTTTSAVTRAKVTIVITTPINVAALAFELIVVIYGQLCEL